MKDDFKNVTLYDESGNEVEFEVITKLDIEDKEYFIVAPNDSQDDDAWVLKIEKDKNGEEVFVTIEDDEEFNMVAEAYDILFSEQ